MINEAYMKSLFRDEMDFDEWVTTEYVVEFADMNHTTNRYDWTNVTLPRKAGI